jgi:hypothetical protein
MKLASTPQYTEDPRTEKLKLFLFIELLYPLWFGVFGGGVILVVFLVVLLFWCFCN